MPLFLDLTTEASTFNAVKEVRIVEITDTH